MSKICLSLDRGVFQNNTLDGPAADQDKIREELHNEYEEKKICHIYNKERHCHCGEKCVVWDWGTDIVKQIVAAVKREMKEMKEREATVGGEEVVKDGFIYELLRETQVGGELLKNIEDGKTFEELLMLGIGAPMLLSRL